MESNLGSHSFAWPARGRQAKKYRIKNSFLSCTCDFINNLNSLCHY